LSQYSGYSAGGKAVEFGFDSQQGKYMFFCLVLGMGPIQFSIHKIREAYSSEAKRQEREAELNYSELLNERVLRITTHLKLNSLALVRKQTVPTERTPHIGEFSANYCG
jgi:hypothetical protein